MGFGSNSREVIVNFTKIAKALQKKKRAEFYMPPRIVDELFTFVKEDEGFVQDLLSAITVKSPDIARVEFPAATFYKLVDDIRNRSYRGMKVAEEVIDQTAVSMLSRDKFSKVEYQKALGEFITRLRTRYRQATRVKFLDSVADLDLIVLARELDGTVISSDEGVRSWGREFGIKEITPRLVKRQLETLL